MSDSSTIKINPAKNSDLEFEVMIQGIDDTNIPSVKFVITSEADQCDYAFKCKRIDGEKFKWIAKLPALTHVKESTVPFHVEVVVDGYYFEPAQGNVILVTDPSVKFQPLVSKPTVTTSFTVKQEEDKPKKVDESEITGQYAPTNGLLTPEEDPMHSSVKTADAMKNDEHINHARIEDISSSVLPGETTDPEPQVGNNEEEEFDPRRVADTIVKSTFGSVKKPETRGTLFARDKSGKPVVKGLDTPANKAAKAANAAKVKEILKKD